jgi:flagellar biosynthesis/type III secretory pathway protein FliH
MKYEPTIQAIVDAEIATTEAKVREEYAGLVEKAYRKGYDDGFEDGCSDTPATPRGQGVSMSVCKQGVEG